MENIIRWRWLVIVIITAIVFLGAMIAAVVALVPQLPQLWKLGLTPLSVGLLAVFTMLGLLFALLAAVVQVVDFILNRLVPKKPETTSTATPTNFTSEATSPQVQASPPVDYAPLGAAVVPEVKVEPSDEAIRQRKPIKLIGREAELAKVKKAFADGRRVVLILGFGGIGKTRLAVETADTMGTGYSVVWYTVNTGSTLEDLTAMIRTQLGLEAGTDAAECWRQLGKGRTLLVLDNAEDLQQPGDFAGRINGLDAGQGARVLVTSRVKWPELDNQERVELEAMPPDVAIELVKAMMHYINPEHSLAGYEAEIAEAARRHPRLIEFAVRWAHEDRAADVLTMLKTLEGDDPEKLLEDLVGKTVKRMSERDGAAGVAMLKRLAVCRGGFTRAAAEAIAGDYGTLKTLSQWGLVEVDFETERYSLDAMVTQYTGRDESAQRPHYAYYKALAWAHHKKQDYLGLDVESDNLTAAFEWAMAEEQYEDALWLANACYGLLLNRGRFEQKLRWSIEVAEALKDQPDKMLWANAQNSLGVDYRQHPIGDRAANLRRAIDAYEAALVYWTAEAAPLDYAGTQMNLGSAYNELSRITEPETNLKAAITAYQAALSYYTPETAPLNYGKTHYGLGNSYAGLAKIEEQLVNFKRAITAYETALLFCTPQTAPLDYALTQENVGLVYWDLSKIEAKESNLEKAIAAYQEALRFLTAQAAPYNYPKVQRHLGLAYEDMGDKAKAAECWREAERYFRQGGMVRDADMVAGWLGGLEG